MRRIAAFVVGVMLAGPVWAEKLSLGAISGYLNQLNTAEGAFTQINGDGSISTGQIYIKRPGRMRFEYNAPDSTVVVAGANTVVIVDRKSNTPPETYPLNRTPLSLILARNVDLERARMVVGHAYDGTATKVIAQDPDNPDYGNIELMFTANPVELRQWVIHDGNGTSTTVILGDLSRGGSLPNRLFDTSRYGAGRD